MNVTSEYFNSVTAATLIFMTLPYKINDANCVKFALAGFNNARPLNPLVIPDTYNTIGYFFGKTPIGVYKKLSYMKTHNDPEAGQIDIGNFTSPQSHGPCN